MNASFAKLARSDADVIDVQTLNAVHARLL